MTRLFCVYNFVLTSRYHFK